LIVPLTVEGDVDCFLQLSKNIPARTKNKHNAFFTTPSKRISLVSIAEQVCFMIGHENTL